MGTNGFFPALPIAGGVPSAGGHPPSDRLDLLEQYGVGLDHGRTGDHDAICLQCIMDYVSIPERLHLGVDDGGREVSGGAQTGLLSVPDK